MRVQKAHFICFYIISHFCINVNTKNKNIPAVKSKIQSQKSTAKNPAVPRFGVLGFAVFQYISFKKSKYNAYKAAAAFVYDPFNGFSDLSPRVGRHF